jgi:hypothetical protein
LASLCFGYTKTAFSSRWSQTKQSEMKTENKGGRPVKVAGQKKGYCISVKMDTREY